MNKQERKQIMSEWNAKLMNIIPCSVNECIGTEVGDDPWETSNRFVNKVIDEVGHKVQFNEELTKAWQFNGNKKVCLSKLNDNIILCNEYDKNATGKWNKLSTWTMNY